MSYLIILPFLIASPQPLTLSQRMYQGAEERWLYSPYRSSAVLSADRQTLTLRAEGPEGIEWIAVARKVNSAYPVTWQHFHFEPRYGVYWFQNGEVVGYTFWGPKKTQEKYRCPDK